MTTDELSFEEAMQRVSGIIGDLERGDVSLSDSMALFEEGTALLRRCGTLLDSAKQQVVELRAQENGAPEELPFTPKQA